MKKRYPLFNQVLLCLIFLSLSIATSAQQVPITLPANTLNNIAGYYEALPAGYNTTTDKYPIIIFLHGMGELQYNGANPPRPLSAVLANGIPKLIQQGEFPASFTVNNKTFSFIVITPQFINSPGSTDVNNLLAYLKTKYRVDTDRIYITGLSMGGGATWATISENAVNAKQYAAAAIVCGNYNLSERPADWPYLPAVIAANNTPVWAFHNNGDPTVNPQLTIDWVTKINACIPAPNPLAKMTIFNANGHDAWTQAYSPDYKDPATGLNVYQWMLQYSKGGTVPPPVTTPVTGNKRITVSPNRGSGIYYTDAMNQLNITPGDTLCIAAGDYDYIQFSKLVGTAEKPIVIMNCGGLVRVGIKSTATAAAFVFSTCSYFKLEGTGDNSIKYGFDVNGTNQQGEKMFGLFFGDGTSDFDAHHVFVHDASMFVQAKTLQSCDHPEWLETRYVMKNVKIHDMLCRNSTWEGFYIGNTHYLYSSGSCVDMKSHHIQNLEVYNNDLENMGSDGIQIAMTDLGDNRVYNNKVVNYAIARNSAHGYGIMSGGGSTLKIYNNRVDKGYNPGVQIFGSGINYVYNNVISNITFEGINAIDKLVFQPATAYIYNNTIYNTGVNGIKVYADLTTIGHKIYNNLVIAEGTQWDYPQTGYYIRGSNPIKFDFLNNLNFKTPGEACIADALNGNFRLVAGSKAINAGRDMQDLGLTTDLENNPRPQDTKFDVGAYEFKSGTNNITPSANAGADIFIALPVNSIQLDGSASTDADGTISTYAWKKVSGPVTGNINTPDAVRTAVGNLSAGTYVFELTVTDDKGVSSSDYVSVFVLATAARPPVIKVGDNVTIKLPSNSVQLDGSSSYDPDGIIVKYNWVKKSGPVAGAIDDYTSSNTNATGLVQGVYVFELTITNNDGKSATATMTVTVQGEAGSNKPPVANAGNDVTITLPLNTVSLDGSASKDEDGTIVTWKWEKLSGPAGGAIASAATAKTNITGLLAGTYVYQLTVTDNSGAAATARVNVIVKAAVVDNKPPVANAGSDITITLPVNTTSLDGSASKDEDGSIVTWKWEKLSGPAGGAIASTATAKTNITGLLAGTYVYQLTVTDNSGAAATARVNVIVKAAVVDNKPPVANAGSDITITLPVNTASLDGNASKDEDGSIVTWKWEKLSGPAGGAIASAATAKTNITGLLAGTYVYQLTVTDNSGAAATARVTVTVKDAVVNNKPPVADAGGDIKMSLPINTVILDGNASYDPDGTIVSYEWSQLDGPSSAIIARPGNVQTTATGLLKGIYTFQLKVTDDGGLTAIANKTVTVLESGDKHDQDSLDVQLFPNLLTGNGSAKLVINNNVIKMARITVYDSRGVTVIRQFYPIQNTLTTNLDFSSFGSGIYFVVVRGDSNFKWVGRLLKL